LKTGDIQDLKEHSLIAEKVDTLEIGGLKQLIDESYNWERIAEKTVLLYNQVAPA